jgi:predicted small integral membrane protein
MDSVPPESPLRGRAIESPTLQAAMYWTVVAWEAVAALLCRIGGGLQARSFRGDAAYALFCSKSFPCCGN